jgi:chorismate mutase
MHTVTTTNTDEMTSAPDLPTDPESGETVPILRDQIDAIDTAIARLVAERVRLSRRIQTLRLNSGGTRVQLGRERIILEHYRAALGPDGPVLGEAVLRVSRGVH